MVGSYRLGAVLGEGGMSTVYAGHHVLVDRDAAIKVLSAELAHDGALVERFLDEARALATARSPGVVDLWDCGLLDDGRPFMVLERLHGHSLGEHLRERGHCELDETAMLARTLARILDVIHRRGVVHRDLTPDNVFLLCDGPGPRVKLLDFGVADEPAPVLHSAVVVGTPAYMAPEQCLDPQSVDARADLYALGCMVFEMVAGRPPFGGDDPDRIMRAHVEVPAPRLRDQLPEVPVELDDIVAALLAKDPGDRIPSARVLLQRLEACGPMHGEPERPPGAWFSAAETTPVPGPPVDAQRTRAAPWPRWWAVRSFLG